MGYYWTNQDSQFKPISGQIAYSNTPVLFKVSSNETISDPIVLNYMMYIYKNEIRRLSSGYLVTNLYKVSDNIQSINLTKVNENRENIWTYNVGLDQQNILLINTVVEADGSVAIALVESDILKILTTLPL